MKHFFNDDFIIDLKILAFINFFVVGYMKREFWEMCKLNPKPFKASGTII